MIVSHIPQRWRKGRGQDPGVGRVSEEYVFLLEKRQVIADALSTVGKTLAYTQMSFYNVKGELCAKGSHTK